MTLVVCGLVSWGFFLFFAILGNLGKRMTLFLPLYLLSFASYLLAIRYAVQHPAARPRDLYLIGVFALLFRLTLLPGAPALSDDLYRYLWEGNVQIHGFNPYLHPPNAEELSGLRDEYYPHVNHPSIPTIYPPLSQWLFAGVAKIHYSVTAFKAVFLCFDLATALLVWRVLVCAGGNPLLYLIYAWNPLVIVETSSSGHLDGVGVFFLVLSLLLFLQGKRMLSLFPLGLSVLIKVLPALFIPFYFQKLRGRERPAVLLLLPMFFLAYLPYMDAGRHLFHALIRYGEAWEFNASAFSLLGVCVASREAREMIVSGALVALAIWLWRRELELSDRMFLLLGALFVVTPVLYPWYLIWIVPFLTLRRSAAWIYLTAGSFLSYRILPAYLETGIWQEQLSTRLLEYVPFYLLLASGPLVHWIRRQRTPHESEVAP